MLVYVNIIVNVSSWCINMLTVTTFDKKIVGNVKIA